MLQGRSLAVILCILNFQRKRLYYSSRYRTLHGQNAFLCFQQPIDFQIWILTKQPIKVSNLCHLLGLELMTTFSAESWGGNLQLSPWPSLLPYSMTSTCPSGTLHFNKYLWPVVMVPLLSQEELQDAQIITVTSNCVSWHIIYYFSLQNLLFISLSTVHNLKEIHASGCLLWLTFPGTQRAAIQVQLILSTNTTGLPTTILLFL